MATRRASSSAPSKRDGAEDASSTRYPRRRRRRPEESEREILAATEAFLGSRPFRELNVAELMDQTELGRSSFYQYFRDRDDLVVRLLEKLGDEILQLNQVWFEGDGDTLENLRSGYEAIGRFWAARGPVLRAIAAAATHEPEVEAAYRKLLGQVIRGVAERIRADIARGAIAPLDPDETAHALVVMSEAFLNEKLGRRRKAKWRPAVETLITIWERTLYGQVR